MSDYPITMEIQDNRFYVYLIIDPDTKLPFYVGKGTGNRYLSHQKNYKGYIDACKMSRQPVDLKEAYFEMLEEKGKQCEYEIIKELNNEDALLLEQAFIAWFGRKLTGNGILTNKLSGGESGSLYFDEQALISLFPRNDLIKHILKWERTSTAWIVRTLLFCQKEGLFFTFRELPIDLLYTSRCHYEEFAIKTLELIKQYDSVITPLYWVRRLGTNKPADKENVYIMKEGLDMIKGYWFEEDVIKSFSFFIKTYEDFFDKKL
jgi:hypothetical protein